MALPVRTRWPLLVTAIPQSRLDSIVQSITEVKAQLGRDPVRTHVPHPRPAIDRVGGVVLDAAERAAAVL